MGAWKAEEFDESALVCLLPDLAECIQPLREKYTVDGAQGAPPHITLLYPFLSSSAWNARAEMKLRAVTSATLRADVSLERLSWFDDAGVLILKPKPTGEILDLIQRLAKALPDCPPYGGEMSLDELIPHVTIAVAKRDQDRSSIEREALAAIGHLLPIGVCLDGASLLVRRASVWNSVLEFPFGG